MTTEEAAEAGRSLFSQVERDASVIEIEVAQVLTKGPEVSSATSPPTVRKEGQHPARITTL